MKKIAFSGPSGLGKTTLCKFVKEELMVPWISVSAGDLFTKEDKLMLKNKHGYEGAGHKAVINLSAINPAFGADFQATLLARRAELIRNTDEFVIDRSPIDNVVYMLSQNGHNQSEEFIGNFIKEAREAYAELTHVILIRFSSDIPAIEDNNSRVPNRFFQRTISDLFQSVYAREFANIIGPEVIVIDFWDLDQRKGVVQNFITGRYHELREH